MLLLNGGKMHDPFLVLPHPHAFLLSISFSSPPLPFILFLFLTLSIAMGCNDLIADGSKCEYIHRQDTWTCRPYRNETFSQFFLSFIACRLGPSPVQHRETDQVDAENIPRPGSPIMSILLFVQMGACVLLGLWAEELW